MASSMKGTLLAALGLILFLVLSLFWLGPPPLKTHRHSYHRVRSHPQQHELRLAIVIPFVGDGIESVPPYFQLFCTAAEGSAELVDFLIIHNGALEFVLPEDLPSNVILINLGSTRAMSEALLDVTDHRDLSSDKRKLLREILTNQLERYPYILVEYKPSLGHIFAKHLSQYSHWGYSDLDIAFGDLPRWITQEELTEYDIVTYGFGDQDRVYLRGQFTFHKNSPKVNQVWRGCKYLEELDVRFEEFMKNKKFSLESAEGCYSSAVLQRNDLRVKYAVKAFTDVNDSDTANTHGLYLGFGSSWKKDRSIVSKHDGSANNNGFNKLLWFDGDTGSEPLQWEVGEKELVVRDKHNKNNRKCMYWAKEKYQTDICVDGLKSTDTVFWIDGKLYRQPYASFVARGLVTAPFFHFQEWKRYYRTSQLTACRRHGGADACVLTKEGAIPMTLPEKTASRGVAVSPLGLFRMNKWRGVSNAVDRRQLPITPYCFRSSPRKFPPVPPTTRCEWLTYWQDEEVVEILSGAPGWKHVNINKDVTLTMTLQLSDMESSVVTDMLDILEESLHNWQGQPCVIVIFVSGATDESVAAIRKRFQNEEGSATFDSCLAAAVFGEEPDVVSRNTLLNMARDVAPTRWIMTGLEVERGLILSKEATLFAHRGAQVYSVATGTAMLVPQFSVDGVAELDVSTFLETESSDIGFPDRLDCGFCGDDGSDALFQPAYNIWRELTIGEVAGETLSRDSTIEVALGLERFQQSLVSLLATAELEEIRKVNTRPILLVDNVGPDGISRTTELAREVEELGGLRCYNGLWLAQLITLGYSANVVAGAFAASSLSSRRAACRSISQEGTPGTSRCHGCFMIDDERILNHITEDERMRPAKAAILWQVSA